MKICVIHEAIGNQGAIARIAKVQMESLLAEGHEVSVVAKYLAEDLVGQVEWLRLYVPPKVYALKWLTAGNFMRKAIAGRKFDVVLTHQPQGLPMADVFYCHFLTRALAQHNCMRTNPGLRGLLDAIQNKIVMKAEDRLFSSFRGNASFWFVIDLFQKAFHGMYGPPKCSTCLYPPGPSVTPVSAEERMSARQYYLGNETSATVIGFLGGIDFRKGLDRLMNSDLSSSAFLLAGGPGTESSPSDDNRVFTGLVKDPFSFYAACDMLIVPSRFEPFGLVAVEAASRGLPVIATEEVGCLDLILKCQAGQKWNPETPLSNVINSIREDYSCYSEGALQMARLLSSQNHHANFVQALAQTVN